METGLIFKAMGKSHDRARNTADWSRWRLRFRSDREAHSQPMHCGAQRGGRLQKRLTKARNARSVILICCCRGDVLFLADGYRFQWSSRFGAAGGQCPKIVSVGCQAVVVTLCSGRRNCSLGINRTFLMLVGFQNAQKKL